jgi:hypothetical protein
MASAAAVAADEARSPVNNDLGEDEGRVGEITSGIYSKDEGLPGQDEGDDDDDEELPANPLNKRGARRRMNGNVDDEEEEGRFDLFGDDEEAVAAEVEKLAYVFTTARARRNSD